MKKIVLLILVLVIIDVVIISKKNTPVYLKFQDGTYTSSIIREPDWEYLKERLFSGKGDGEYVYKIGEKNSNAPILIDIRGHNLQDSLVVDEIIADLRRIIPNKKIDYFKNFSGKSFEKQSMYLANGEETIVNGISIGDLRFSTIHLDFRNNNNPNYFQGQIKTLLPDGSSIQRTNTPRIDRFYMYPSRVLFHFKKSLSKQKRKKYIKYELLRTLCYLYPNNSKTRSENSTKGIFFTPHYMPDIAQFTLNDELLLKKLYSKDFIEEFKTYLYKRYGWRYSINFLNKSFTKKIAWGTIISLGMLVCILLLGVFRNRKFKNSYLQYFCPICFIMLYLIKFVFIHEYITNLKMSYDLNIMLSGILISIIAALIVSIPLWFVEKYLLYKELAFSYNLILKVFLTFFIFCIPAIIIFLIKGRMAGFLEFYFPVFVFTVVLAIGRGVLIYLDHFSQNLIKQKDLELSNLKILKSQAEVKLLQSQINPHFLYNSLNSIASLAPKDAAKTEKMALSLSDLFKYTINRKGKKNSSIGDEVEMVKNYLEVEQIRFGDRLSFKIDVEDGMSNKEIPMFLIQPLIENAVKHGISQIEDEGNIELNIFRTDKNINIEVKDNGPLFPEGLVSGHGLQTVYDLLELTYGENAILNMKNTPEKKVSIIIKDILNNE